MSSTNRPIDGFVSAPVVTNQVFDYHDRVRWGPIFSGLVVALAFQLLLSSLGAAVGSGFISDSGAPRSNAPDVNTGVGIWSIISLLISLFIGGWFTAYSCGPMNRNTAFLNGTILWATTLALSSWLLASGVSGASGALASNAGAVTDQVQQGAVNLPNNLPNVTADRARVIAEETTRGLWSFFFGSLLGLVASLVGCAVGVRKHRSNQA